MRGKDRRGVTLTELSVSVVIMSVGVLGLFGAFRFIMTSLHVSRTQTIATNLAQEQVEILKSLSYYDLLITTSSALIPGTAQPYDVASYPPETRSISGMTFTRYTYVNLAQMQNNVVTAASSNYPDTGLKQINVSVVWRDRSAQRMWSISNLLENPNVAALTAGFSGRITVGSLAGPPLPGALIQVQQNPGWSAVSGANGDYSFNVSPGAYTLLVSSSGYYDAHASYSANAGADTSADLFLSAIATGTIAGNAWYNPGVVISQVVSASSTYVGALVGGALPQTVEYVELFNPTTAQIDATSLNLNFGGGHAAEDRSGFVTTYVSTYIPPFANFLIANTSFFLFNGQWQRADAYYPAGWPASVVNVQAANECGALKLTSALSGTLDQVGWSSALCDPGQPGYGNGAIIPTIAGIGAGNQLVRVSSPAASLAAINAYGRAYNSGSNANDFLYPTIAGFSGIYSPPRGVKAGAVPVISGVPAVGAEVASTDAYSGSVEAYAAYIASGAASCSGPATGCLLYAPFRLAGVTTGLYSVDLAVTDPANGVGYLAHIDSVAVAQGATTWIPNATTVSSAAAFGVPSVLLKSSGSNGFLKGIVTDLNNNPLGGIMVQAGGVTRITGSNGLYFAVVPPGTVTVTANPNNLNASYVQQVYTPAVNAGQIAIQDIALSKGGSLYGYAQYGTLALPNQVFYAYDANSGNQVAAAMTDNTGYFYLRNVSTGTYDVAPQLGAGQTSSPGSASGLNFNGAGQVFVGTFTVSGAVATLSGQVTYNGAPVTSGALIVAYAGAAVTSPPAIAASTASALGSPYYAVTALADGSYSLAVATSTANYNVYVSMPLVGPNGSVSTAHSGNVATVAVHSAGVTQTLNLGVP